ncbi:hypothetical protein ACQUQP_17180 [Marinobacterium sp. YM272]|uniref:hypothetical protein n=1 Tax=Marinobacterium sp. YM272 TaxID=3421654 RepID=UPI003D7F1F2D
MWAVVSTLLLLGTLSAEVRSAEVDPADVVAGGASVNNQRYRLQARIDQLYSEARGLPAISFAPGLLSAAEVDPAVVEILAEARMQFERRREEVRQKQAQLRTRLQDSVASIDGQQQLLNANRRRLAMIRGKLKSLEPAIEKGLIGENYISALSGEVEHLNDQCDALEAGIGRIKRDVAEYALALSQQTSERRKIVQVELESLKRQLALLVPQREERETIASGEIEPVASGLSAAVGLKRSLN